MDATFLQRIKSDFPKLTIRAGKRFAFRPPSVILVGPEEPRDDLLFLHEIGHALSGHHDFDTGARRLKMEVEAWEKARQLSAEYGIGFDEEIMERELDTYRDWLHTKSTCRKCGLTCYQTPDGVFHCPRCENLT